ncbi:hypothetical protein GCK72_003966 [Caenorhabditis remanei]|uniref:Uncharacterized protein n=1 Tax=Caenorhabditis remanei TaxID=31234 RepID=A0A6A5H849_CAERE|nr:hypothetical protein GCK72_003966 [Caenorhabditis remanei]KAF1764020.1 hypothetical protein GCK72_003966 [Caenorhabditis remanei]
MRRLLIYSLLLLLLSIIIVDSRKYRRMNEITIHNHAEANVRIRCQSIKTDFKDTYMGPMDEETLTSGVMRTGSSDSPNRLTSSAEVHRAEKTKHGSCATTVSTWNSSQTVLASGNGSIHHSTPTPSTPSTLSTSPRCPPGFPIKLFVKDVCV